MLLLELVKLLLLPFFHPILDVWT